jgi:tetratricopeptide (TPR) repeat protein
MRGRAWRLVGAACVVLGAIAVQPAPAAAQATAPQVSRPRRPPATFEDLARGAAEAREAGRIEEAVSLYERAVKMRPSWDEGLWYLGTRHYEKDRNEAARDALQRFVILKPDAGMGWALLGLCEYRVRAYDAALDHLRRASQRDLAGGEEVVRAVRLHLGLLYARQGEFELSLYLLSSLASAKTPPPRDVCEALGIALLRARALPSEVAEDRRPLVLALGRAGWSQFSGDMESAAKAYAELAERFPREPNVIYSYAVFRAAQGALHAADLFQRTIDLDEGHVFARLHLAHLKMRGGDFGSARILAEEAVKLAPEQPAARDALGRVLVELGEVDSGIAELEMGIRLAPESPEMHFALARAYGKAGRSDAAERTMARFKELEAKARALRGEPPEAPLRGAAPQR